VIVSTNTKLVWIMQHVCIGQPSTISGVLFVPVINMNPADHFCMLLLGHLLNDRLVNRTLKMHVLPVLLTSRCSLKAVQILASNSLTVLCRLGGFHMLMSYLDSIGEVMSGSVFSDALNMCYGLNAVIHMMPGKAFSHALRGCLLVDAAVTARLMSLVIRECSYSADVEAGGVLCRSTWVLFPWRSQSLFLPLCGAMVVKAKVWL